MPSLQPSAIISAFAAVFGVGLYFWEIPARREARNTLAWQVLAAQGDHPGNAGQKWALEVLAKNNVSLHGVRVKRADLTGSAGLNPRSYETDPTALQLGGATLNWALFFRSNMGRANFAGASLQNADLRCTSLGHANFSGADLTGAELGGADLTGADFSGATLKDATSEDACVLFDDQQPKGFPKKLEVCKPWEKNDPNSHFGHCKYQDYDH